MPPRRLTEYERRRDFGATPEPAGGGAASSGGAPRFVVQEHHATRLHWDLRLEHEGVAVSWAIPNGLPMVPSENRKAVPTEDHPLEYLEFEGDIPAGQYGAGAMRIWDRGTYEPHKFDDAKVEVTFHGERLRARYALFKAGKDWLIHRMDPPDEGREPMPERIVPMLARVGELPREVRGWSIELKWDGVRAIAHCRPGRVQLCSRNLRDVTEQYPEVRRLSRSLGAREAVLDGELVAFDAEGRPSFEELQQRIHQTAPTIVRRRMKSHPVTYMIFDLLYLDGRDLMGEPYERRRELLTALELAGPNWQTPANALDRAPELLAASAERGLEGLVLKRLDSVYEPGRRSTAWVKVKNAARQEVVIAGWVPGQGRRAETIGGLLMGFYEEDEDGRLVLRYAGRVGSGLSDAQLADLLERLEDLRRATSPFTGPQPERSAIFAEPELVAEVAFSQWTSEKQIRHPIFKGLRADKAPTDVRFEPALARGEERASGPSVPAPAGARATEIEVDGRTIRLSNLGKVLYPAGGFTKRDVVDYHARIAPALLPHLRDRPLSMRRFPNGVDGETFWEKRAPSHRPDWVRTAIVHTGSAGDVEHLVVDDLPTLVWVANLASLELHTPLALAGDMNRPTVVAFDLDPGEPAELLDCCEIGLVLRGMLEALGLRSYPKTSGGKGMQVYVPLDGTATQQQCKSFARAVAETMEQRMRDRVVSRMTKSLRRGRVLIDWSQNDARKTTVCVYSLRARTEPTVSTPLAWDELAAAAEAGDPSGLRFAPREVLDRVERHGDLFAPTLAGGQSLPAL